MTDEQKSDAYQVLARKYRPQDFATLIGQDAMVRVLKNAFETGRIHHAYVLTGVRGVGKTTTARIVAKGLNCIGKNGKGGPTVEPCGVCEHCLAITDSRHVDVLEMDAASHTGIDDIREIIEASRYRPASARYKVYIIDETHMLSKAAFNGLLKTLEEPPEHVKFIFATTEIRKMPVTVLSRCQRFDLRRIETPVMIAHLRSILEAESVEAEDEALALIARAAEGSVRDALSLLDQAIANGGGALAAGTVREMLGLADQGRVLDLFDLVMKGDAAGALAELRDQYDSGADPAQVLKDLAETAHWLSTLKVAPDGINDPALPPDKRERGAEMAGALSMRVLARAWQMLLKALEELTLAPSAIMAAEMAVIRLCYVAELPSPEEAIRKLGDAPRGGSAPKTGAAPPPSPAPKAQLAVAQAKPAIQSKPTPEAAPIADTAGLPQRFEQVVKMIRERRDGALLYEVENHMRLARYEPGMIEFTPTEGAPQSLAGELQQKLQRWTGARWGVIIVPGSEARTIAEQRREDEASEKDRIRDHPAIQAAFAAFPEAEIVAIRPIGQEPVNLDAETGFVDYDDAGEASDPFGEE